MEKTLHLFHRLIIKTNEEVKNQIHIRNKVFLFISLLVLILGLITTGFNLFYSVSKSETIHTVIYLLSLGILILAVFGKNITDNFRISLIVLFLYINGMLMLLKWGLQGTGQLYLFLIPIVTAILRRKTATIIGVAVNAITFVYIKIFIDYGIFASPELLEYSTYSWVVMGSSFVAFNSLVTIFIYQIVKMFIVETDTERSKVEVLSSEMEKLSRVNAKFQSIIEENQEFKNKDFKAQRLESVGRLTSGIANEFNNLITVIVGYTDILLSISENDDMYNRLLRKVKISGKAAENLVSKLLAFSKNLVLKNKIVNLNDTLLDMEESLRSRMRSDINFTIELPEENCLIKIDPVQLEKIIHELVINSTHALPRGGNIKISVLKEKFDAGFAEIHEMEGAGEYVVLTVEDDGTGMDDETREKAIEPFFSTKGLGEALGLGLSVIYGVVKQCGGELIIESVPGEGTSVKILLLSQQENLTFHKDEKIIPTDLRGSETILLVEDDKLVRSVMVEVLHNYGYKIITANDGEDGLAKFKSSDEKINLVIADIVMPKMGGMELVGEIEKNQSNVKVLFMSGYVEKIHNLHHAGLNYIKKPFDPLDLVKKIRFVLDTKNVTV